MKAKITPAKKPRLPEINESGAYCAEDLRRYFREAREAAMMDVEIARHLRVEVHRVVYFKGVIAPSETLDGRSAPGPMSRLSIEKKRPHGTAKAYVDEALRRGDDVTSIATRLGWASPGGVYQYAKKLGIVISNGRAVLS